MFHLISWCENFVESHSLRRETPKTLQKLNVSTKFPHQEISWNFGISCKLHFSLSSLISKDGDTCFLFVYSVRKWPWSGQKKSGCLMYFQLWKDLNSRSFNLNNRIDIIHQWQQIAPMCRVVAIESHHLQ